MPSVMTQRSFDTPVRDLPHLSEQVEARLREAVAPPAPAPAPPPLRSLRRTGNRPLMFNGVTVATICGVTPALPFWYELNVHRTVIDTYVTDIRLFHKSSDMPDLFRVAEHDDLDSAMAYLERYSAAGDILPPQEFARAASSAAELALSIARLQLQVDQATQHYRTLAGELLDALTRQD